MVSVTGSAATVEEVSSALISRGSTPKLIGVSSSNRLLSNFFLSKHRLDIKNTIFGESSRSVVIINLELPVSSSGKSDIVAPLSEIEEIKIILKDKLAASEDSEQGEQDCELCFHSRIYMINNLQVRALFKELDPNSKMNPNYTI